jgi:hypothetical protein
MRALRIRLSRRSRLMGAGVAAAAIVAGSAAVIAGAVDGGGGSRPTPAASRDPGSDPRAPNVLRDYQAYWGAYLKAADTADAGSADLAAHATGEELARARTALTARRQAGEVVRGRYEHKSVVAALADTTATVTDCLTPRTAVYNGKDGKLKASDPPHAQSLTIDMRLENGTWKVALVSAGNTTTCGS